MEQHLPADSPEKFRFRAESLRSASAGKQACCLYAAQRRSAAFSALSAGILLPQRRAAFSAAVGASSMAMTAGTARRAQSSVLPVF